ncbi:MAG: PTS lactose transporter subunit IIB [Dermabacter sp.]|nr:PTS lactose transporter subunit IIB [Dermabacter sp.]
MAELKTIAVVCGAGVATSTLIADHIIKHCVKRGIRAAVIQSTVMDMLSPQFHADAIVTTVPIPESIGIPVVSGMSILLGTDHSVTFDSLDAVLGY